MRCSMYREKSTCLGEREVGALSLCFRKMDTQKAEKGEH